MLSQLINTSERTTIPLECIKTDGGTQMRATLDPDTVQEYLDAMQPVGWGEFPAVVVYYDGKDHWLADGFHRVEAYRLAAANLDQPANVPADVRSGTRRDAILHAAGANASHGLRRTNADKRRAVETLLRDDDWRHWSDREIARRCNVSDKTVADVRRSLTAEIRSDNDRTYTTKHGTTATMQTANIGAKPVETEEDLRQRIRENDRRMMAEINGWPSGDAKPQRDRLWADDLRTIVDAWADENWPGEWPENPSHTNGTFWQQITTWLHKNFDRPWYESDLKFAIKQAAAERRRNQPVAHAIDIDVSTTAAAATVQVIEFDADEPTAEFIPVSQRDDYDSDEWYTPADYIEAARRAMGSIDLDPATCEMAQTVVNADVYLTKMDNGLGARWLRENVWLNPPYSNSQVWIDKLLREVDGVFVKQAIVLVNNATETAWFQSLLARSTVVCFPGRRLQFWRHDHSNVGARQGQAIFYIGPNDAAFIAEFEQFGTLMRRVM